MLRTAAALSDESSELVFDALGNPIRRQILRLLANSPHSVGELASTFTVTRPAISRHLALLKSAGLVHLTPAGNRNVYALDQAGFERTAAWLNRFWNEAEARLRLVAENLPERDDG